MPRKLVEFDETTRYGMVSYGRDDTVEIAFAKQKQYISLYVLRTDVAKAHRDHLGGLDVGKSCNRYRLPVPAMADTEFIDFAPKADQIDFDVVRSILEATVRGAGEVC